MLQKLFRELPWLQFLNYHCTVLRGASSANKVGERTLTARKCFDAVVLSQVFFLNKLALFFEQKPGVPALCAHCSFHVSFPKASKERRYVGLQNFSIIIMTSMAWTKTVWKRSNNHQKVPKLCKNLSKSAKIATVTFKTWIVVDGSLVNCQLLMGIRSKFYKDNRVLRVHPHLKCQAHQHQNQI